MCNPPKAILDLGPDLDAPTTERTTYVCPNDPDHTVLIESWAVWDPIAQRLVQGDLQDKDIICSECEAEAIEEEISIETSQIIRACLTDTKEQIAALTRTNTASTAGACVCLRCNGSRVKIDAHSDYDPTLDRFEIVATYDKGGVCDDCESLSSFDTMGLSAHEAIKLCAIRSERIKSLQQQVAEISAWLESQPAMTQTA
jgi:hypothetical protein